MRMFLDIETAVGPHPVADDLLVVGWAVDDGPVRAVDAEGIVMGYASPFFELLADPAVTKVEHTKYDARFLMLAGYEMNGPIEDTSVMAYVLNENTPLDIDWLSWRYANIDMDKRLRRSGGVVWFRDDDGNEWDLNTWEHWPEPVRLAFEEYNVRDVEALRTLHGKLYERLEESEWLDYWQREHVPYTGVLARMETRGLPVAVPAVEALAVELAPEAASIAAELLEEGGLPPSFNLNSGDQLAAYLFSRVVEFKDALVYDKETIECIKSCLDGEHEDCEMDPAFAYAMAAVHNDGDWDNAVLRHVVDLLPEGFTLDKLGRDRVHGHWTVKGRGLKPTPPTKNPLTGEEGKRPSTSSPELLFMHGADPWVLKLCTQYRKLEKLLTTYLTKWPVEQHEGRLYGRFNQTGTVTGRLSSSGPNLQNVPARGTRGKQVRGLFVAPPGKLLVVGDYDQLEMRLMAHLSQDTQLLRIFREGKDPHEELAYAIFGHDIDATSIPEGAATSYRDAAKTLNYAMGYGAGPRKVAQTLSLLGWPTPKDVAKGYLSEMARFYRGLFRWTQDTKDRAKRKGSVATLGGHRRRLRGTFKDVSNWKLVGYGERQAVNAVVQGTAADILRRVMIEVDDALPKLPMLAQVHDELVFEADPSVLSETDETLATLRVLAEQGHGFKLTVPLVFEPHVGNSWAAAKAGADIDIISLLEEE